jgi:hypothetical protein
MNQDSSRHPLDENKKKDLVAGQAIKDLGSAKRQRFVGKTSFRKTRPHYV